MSSFVNKKLRWFGLVMRREKLKAVITVMEMNVERNRGKNG